MKGSTIGTFCVIATANVSYYQSNINYMYIYAYIPIHVYSYMRMYLYTYTHLHILFWSDKEGSKFHIDRKLQNLLRVKAKTLYIWVIRRALLRHNAARIETTGDSIGPPDRWRPDTGPPHHIPDGPVSGIQQSSDFDSLSNLTHNCSLPWCTCTKIS